MNGFVINKGKEKKQVYNWLTNKLSEQSIKIIKEKEKAKLKEKGENASSTLKPIAQRYMSVGRNELCLCGSGKKFKRCCLV